MEPIYLRFYQTRRGDSPVEAYILGIDDIDERAEILDTLQMVREVGARYLRDGPADTKRIEKGLYEIRKADHRIYYVYCPGNVVVLLHACRKQKAKAEETDKRIARQRKREVEREWDEKG